MGCGHVTGGGQKRSKKPFLAPLATAAGGGGTGACARVRVCVRVCACVWCVRARVCATPHVASSHMSPRPPAAPLSSLRGGGGLLTGHTGGLLTGHVVALPSAFGGLNTSVSGDTHVHCSAATHT